MPLPIGQPISVPVEVVCTSLVPPVIVHGRITHYDGSAFELTIHEPVPPLEPGSQVILDLSSTDAPRIIATASEIHGTRLRVLQKSVNPPDKRVFPRLYGNVELKYRVIDPTEGPSAPRVWVEGGMEDASATPWREPDPFMNFSVTGLKFDDTDSLCSLNDLLAISFSVPTADESFRATARVARIEAIERTDARAEGEEPPNTSVAVEFQDMPREGREALSEFTLLIQGVLL